MHAAPEDLLQACRALEPMQLPILDAQGCVLSAEVVAPVHVPAFATCDQAGFALCVDDLIPGSSLLIVDEVPAGFLASEVLAPGTCIRVERGVPLPEGADAVVGVEATRPVEGGVIIDSAQSGHGFIPVGHYLQAGEVLARTGQVVDADLIGVLARAGLRHVDVHPRPRVLVLTMGAEYVEPGVPTPRGLVADHLSVMVAAIVNEWGATASRIPPALDDLAEVTQVLDDNCHRSDLIIVCGIESDDADRCASGLGMQVSDAGPVRLLHGAREGVVVLGLPDDTLQAHALARVVLPGVLDCLAGRVRA